MKRINTYLGALLLSMGVFLCGGQRAQAQFTVVPLVAGQNEVAGSVTIVPLSDIVYVYYEALPGWEIEEMHVAVATSKAGIPQSKKGNPKIGNFPYAVTGVSVTSHLFEIPFLSDGGVSVAAHAVVRRTGTVGNGGTETGWAAGIPFNGGSWAMYLDLLTGHSGDDGGDGGGDSGGGDGGGGAGGGD